MLLAIAHAANGLSLGGDEPSPLATRLVARYDKAETPEDLTTLFRLQLAAGEFDAAQTTLDRLESAYRIVEPRKVSAIVPWRVYTRSRIYEAAGQSAAAALDRAFGEIDGALSDEQAVKVLPWFGASLSPSASEIEAADAACDSRPLEDCAAGANSIALHEARRAMEAFVPATADLIDRDTRRRFLVEDHVLIATPDGATISALVVRPRQARERRLTALLNFTIYAQPAWSLDDAAAMAAHGYAGVVAYTRGKADSPGKATPYVHDGEDASAVIDWIAHRDWSDGRVGMFSGSYNGFTQWAAAKRHPAALKAIATNATNAPGIDTPMQGNVFQSFIYPWPFYTTDDKFLDDAIYDDRARWWRMEHTWYVSGAPYRDLDRIDGKPNPVFDEWLRHPAYDAYWQRLTPQGREFAGIDIPVFVETGYYDGGMVGALHYFEQHLKYRPQADDRLLVGPYHHTAMQTGVRARVGGETVDKAAQIDLQDLRLDWFDHVFRGKPLPTLLRDRVNFEVMGADAWRHAATLDAMAPQRARLYLVGGADGVHSTLAPAPGGRPVSDLRVDFADRSDADEQPPGDAPDTRDSLVFRTPPLREAIEVDGAFDARFEVSTNKRDFDLAVDMYELTPDGRYLPLSSYLGRASYMQDISRRHLLSPGRPKTLVFRSQTVTARRLAAGSRLVAVVGVPKAPAIQINYGTGKDVSDESIADATVPLVVHWGRGSYLELGVGDAPAFAP